METEVKFKVHNRGALVRVLKNANARLISCEHEQDFYFDDRRRTLRKKVVVLRIRKIGEKGILTVKSKFKRVSRRFKVMNEREVATDNFTELKAILAMLGYRVDGFKEKRRCTYRLGKVNILIDRLPFLGNWMELEGRTRDITKVAGRLKLAMGDSCSKSYGQLFAQFRREHEDRLKPFAKRVDIFSFDCEKRSGLGALIHDPHQT